MKQKESDLLKAGLATVVSIAGSILFFATANSFMGSLWGILFAVFALGGLVNFIRLLTQEKKSPDEIQREIEEKLVDVPKLDSPCQISIERTSSMLGAMNYVAVYLHGFEVGRLKNGKTLNFPTEYATNELKLVYEVGGTVIEKTVPAEAGGSVKFVLNYSKGSLEE